MECLIKKDIVDVHLTKLGKRIHMGVKYVSLVACGSRMMMEVIIKRRTQRKSRYGDKMKSTV